MIHWWITRKEFWEVNHYIDDQHLGFEIPEFGEDMESCFSYQPDYPNDDFHMQSEKLSKLGFEVYPLGVIDNI